ncbi:MAG: lactate permease [Bacillota bacterium]|nr:lactate permease [Bacillota bacterium]
MNMTLMFVLGLAPIIWLVIALTYLKIPGYKACASAMVIAFTLATLVWKMPLLDSFTAVLEGVSLAIWPIIVVIIAAMFTYNVCLHTGSMEVIKKMLTSFTNDKRIIVLIIAWGFGGFMEGMAGFGTAVAIPASMLWALGFNPVFSAIVCLIANATPTAFGSIGIPTTTLAKVAGLDPMSLATATVIQLAPFIILTPFIMVYLTGKFEGNAKKSFKGVGIITLISGLSFLVPEYLVAKYIGAELPVVIGSVFSMVCTIMAAKFFGKGNVIPEFSMKNSKEISNEAAISTASSLKVENKQKSNLNITKKEALKAWSPFILIFIFLIGTSKVVAPINGILSTLKTTVHIYTGDGAAPYVFSWVTTPPIWIAVSAFIGGMIQGAKFNELCGVLKKTFFQMKNTMITLLTILSTAKLMGYSGMISSIANMLVALTGPYYPLISPTLGCLGTFVTGSGTSSSVLFGGLQSQTAIALNYDPTWIAASNTAGVSAGKMISPQSIAIAVGASNLPGKEGELLKGTIKWSVLFLVGYGILNYIGVQLF